MITSFGYAVGDPPDADQVYDERALTHNTSALAFADELTRITEFARTHPDAHIAIGCEHGQYRSVTLARLVGLRTGHQVTHRDQVAHRVRTTPGGLARTLGSLKDR